MKYYCSNEAYPYVYTRSKFRKFGTKAWSSYMLQWNIVDIDSLSSKGQKGYQNGAPTCMGKLVVKYYLSSPYDTFLQFLESHLDCMKEAFLHGGT